MNSFEYGPEDRAVERKGPVLVMPPPPQQTPTKWELWRSRLFLLEFIFVCLVVGIILVAAPWTPLWTNNSLLNAAPRLREFLMNDFVRGLVTGLGLVDIGLAIFEILHYQEPPR